MTAAVSEHARSVQERALRALEEFDLAALVAVSSANVRWLAGTSFLSQRALRTRLALVVVTADTEPVFILEATEAEQARSESWLSDQRLYTQFVDEPTAVLAEVLRERGIDRGRVGFEELSLSARHHAEISELLPDVDWVYAERLFETLRSRKTPLELEILVDGALATDRAIHAAFSGALVGETERSIGDRMIDLARSEGGVFKHIVLATGANTFATHHFPDDTVVQSGDVLRTDFGMTWNDYASDLARTAIMAPVKKHQLDLLRQLEDLHQSLAAAMRPGVPASAIFRLCVSECERRGLDFGLSHVGHGIGLSSENVHESPVLQPHDHTELSPGMVVMLEPLVIGRDGRYAVEDLVEITETGPVIRSRSAVWSEPLVVGG